MVVINTNTNSSALLDRMLDKYQGHPTTIFGKLSVRKAI